MGSKRATKRAAKRAAAIEPKVETMSFAENLPKSAVAAPNTSMSYIERVWSERLTQGLNRPWRRFAPIGVAVFVALSVIVRAVMAPPSLAPEVPAAVSVAEQGTTFVAPKAVVREVVAVAPIRTEKVAEVAVKKVEKRPAKVISQRTKTKQATHSKVKHASKHKAHKSVHKSAKAKPKRAAETLQAHN